jgi:DNA-binding Xre family transcriptional regulator
MTIVRENIAHLMKKQGLPPTVLSLRVGKSKTLVKDLMEKNEDVTLGTLIRLAKGMEVSLFDLLRGVL